MKLLRFKLKLLHAMIVNHILYRVFQVTSTDRFGRSALEPSAMFSANELTTLTVFL